MKSSHGGSIREYDSGVTLLRHDQSQKDMSALTGISKKPIMAILGLSVAIVLAVAVMPYSLAEPQETAEDTPEFGTVTVPINDETSLEKTTMAMNIPEDNTLPWAYVDGVIENHAEGYPVIIQFFNEESGDDPLHVAQVEVNEDGSYEYKFRVRDLDLETGIATNIFEGDYVVKVFKVINSQDDDSESV